MKKYIFPIMGIAMSLGFTGFVAFATIRTAPPATAAEGSAGAQEQSAAVAASQESAPAPSPWATVHAQQEGISAQQGDTSPQNSAVLSPPNQIQPQPDEPARVSHYEDDEEEDEDEDD